MNNTYIVKNLAPWMMDELIAFSKITKYNIVFLRNQDEFYNEGIKELKDNGITLTYNPLGLNNLFKKLKIIFLFITQNLTKFSLDYNSVIGIKSIFWFLKLDLSLFSEKSKIHAQFATQATIVSLLIKKYYNNKPEYSFTFHANDIYFNNKWFELLTRHSHLGFSISEFNVNYVKNKYIDSDKIVLSRLGVFTDSIKPNMEQNENTLKIGLLSWFVKKKGIIYLLEAMRYLKERGVRNIKLKIAGDGPLKNDFISFVKKHQLEDSIEFVGKVKGKLKDEFFDNLDAFVLPSISLKNDQDGIPVVLMEAVAYGLPIISTDVSGIPEICVDDYNGYLIQEKNVMKIEESILSLSNSLKTRKHFAKNALKMSANYDIIINSKMKVQLLQW